MKYNLIFLLLIISSCTLHNNVEVKSPYNSKGFAYIYNDNDYAKKIIKKKLNNESLEIAHNALKLGTLIKITNSKTNVSVILKNSKKVQYPDFYKILITQPVAQKLGLDKKLPLVELFEVKKNKSFIAKKTKIFIEEKKIHSNAPVELVKIDNISKIKKNKKTVNKDNFFIIIGEFYSKSSAQTLKKRIIEKLSNFNSNKLKIKTKNANKISLLSGPYNSINLMKNDYIQLKNFGFEELDISINE